jgi:hypothetical protein
MDNLSNHTDHLCELVISLLTRDIKWEKVLTVLADRIGYAYHMAVGTKSFHKFSFNILCIGFHGLVLLAEFVAYNFLLYFHIRSVHALSDFIEYFPVTSLWHSFVSDIYIAVVILTWVVRWLTLALPKGPNWVGILSLIWGRKQIQFVYCCVL